MSHGLAIFLFSLLTAPGAEPTIGDYTGIGSGRGCGWCKTSQPLLDDFADAHAVVYGTLHNPRGNPDDPKSGTTDLRVITVLKKHAIIEGKQIITLPRLIPVPDPKVPPQFLVYLDMFKGKIDPYRGIELRSDALVKYLEGAMKLDAKKPDLKLLYYARSLGSADKEVPKDAVLELGKIPYRVVREQATKLDAEAHLVRLERDQGDALRDSLDAFLLGHCGNEKHAGRLRICLDKVIQFHGNSLDSLLTGYTLLAPKEGTALLLEILSNPQRPFMERYAALKTLRFFWTSRNDVMPAETARNLVALLLEQPDGCDLAIEEMRRRDEVRYLNKVLSLHDRKDFEMPIIRRAILRYALTFKDKPAARDYVARQRAQKPEWVENTEELMKLEREIDKGQ